MATSAPRSRPGSDHAETKGLGLAFNAKIGATRVPSSNVRRTGAHDRRARGLSTLRYRCGPFRGFVQLSTIKSNIVDGAIAQLLPDVTFYLNWTEALVARSGGLDRDGIVQGFEPVTPDDLGRPVAKAGRITGVTTGIISQVEIDDFAVDLGTSTRRIMRCDDQLEVHAEDGGRSAPPATRVRSSSTLGARHEDFSSRAARIGIRASI